ncbi:Serine-threonine/tyrosine-protein kinase [Hirschfeldia incana]|nr:Serine-threonine/tyrosine-protein kinase [Hirschfeldia incana]
MFSLVDLKTATKNFRPESMIGEGGFGQVFKGWLEEKTLAPSRAGVGIPVTVKKSNSDSAQGLLEWQCEVRFLGKFHHPNLVKLLGYCMEENQFLLVYEYLPKGSLENHLFLKGEALTWDTRLKIAIEAAQGLSFLHNSEERVIYRDFKASNILLDSNFQAKLSNSGLAINGRGLYRVTTVMGTQGYAAPEYIATGHLSVRSDVYGFGVVLLELLTGLRVFDRSRPSAQQNLIEWSKPVLTQKKKIEKMMDPRLEHRYPIMAVTRTAALILRCLEVHPNNRPPMEDVLRELEIVRTIRDELKEERPKRNVKQISGDENEAQNAVGKEVNQDKSGEENVPCEEPVEKDAPAVGQRELIKMITWRIIKRVEDEEGKISEDHEKSVGNTNSVEKVQPHESQLVEEMEKLGEDEEIGNARETQLVVATGTKGGDTSLRPSLPRNSKEKRSRRLGELRDLRDNSQRCRILVCNP